MSNIAIFIICVAAVFIVATICDAIVAMVRAKNSKQWVVRLKPRTGDDGGFLSICAPQGALLKILKII